MSDEEGMVAGGLMSVSGCVRSTTQTILQDPQEYNCVEV